VANLNAHINVTPIIAAIADVLTEPYRDLIEKLLADGRVTATEIQELRTAILDRGDRLADLVRTRLAEDEGSAR
jgi:hypothetical protein